MTERKIADQKSIEEKLFDSEAVNSLRLEREVARLIPAKTWHSLHGSYFTDLATGKIRETDVTALRLFADTRRLRHGIRIRLLIECKSLKRFHFVFARSLPHSQSYQIYQLPNCWLGNTEFLERSMAKLSRVRPDISKRQLSFEVQKRMKSRPDCLIDPSSPEVVASAYRETNVGAERELDSSALWNACLSLNSRFQSEFDHAIAWQVENFAIDEDRAPGFFESEQDRANFLASGLDQSVLWFDFYHPIVVVDARLWTLEENEVVPTKSARLDLSDATEGSRKMLPWVDVLTFEALHQTMPELIRHYEREGRRKFEVLKRHSNKLRRAKARISMGH